MTSLTFKNVENIHSNNEKKSRIRSGIAESRDRDSYKSQGFVLKQFSLQTATCTSSFSSTYGQTHHS